MTRPWSNHGLAAAMALAMGWALACGGAGGTDPSSGAPGGEAGEGQGGDAGGPAQGMSLRIEPADAVVAPSDGESTLGYRAFLRDEAGAESEVSDEAAFTITPQALGLFVGPTLTIPPKALGKATIQAKARGVSGTTSLTIVKKTVVIGPGADASAPDKFGGPADGGGPELVYPASGILVPPNMNSLEVHFIPAPGQTLFELRLVAPTVQLSAYFGCTPLGGGCVYTPDKAFWTALADQARGVGPVAYTLRGVDGATPGQVGVSAEATIEFANEDIVGGLYYWNDAGVIQRYDFGFPGQLAETYLNGPAAGAFACVGCHVLSRDGKKIAVGLDIPSPAPFKVFDVATKALTFAQGNTFAGGANFFSFSPDAKQMLSSDGRVITLRDATTGKAITDPLVNLGTMPDWSPDGKLVVYARPPAAPPLASPGVSSASLALITFDGSAWGAPKPLVLSQGENNYYPSFSPDQGWVAFNRSPSNRDSFDNAKAGDGQVWAVSSAGGTPVRLQHASPDGGDQWPKWAPNVLTYAGGPVMWMTFSSPRAYGLRTAAQQSTQLWMTAFDPARAQKGEDPSFPAFWLPFQDINSGNHIAQWVTQIVRKPCLAQSECASGEGCQNGICVPIIN